MDPLPGAWAIRVVKFTVGRSLCRRLLIREDRQLLEESSTDPLLGLLGLCPRHRFSVSIVDLYTAHDREASNSLCTLVEREKESVQVPAKTVKGT